MMSFETRATIVAAQDLPLETQLLELLRQRVEQLQSVGLLDMTHLLVIQPGDTEDAIIEAIGFSPLTNSMDGVRFGSPDFEPHWQWLQRHEGGFLMTCTVGNSGFGFEFFIQDAPGAIPELLALCHQYAEPGK